MMVIVAPKLVRKGFNGITLFPFIILANKELRDNVRLINHERIHLRQQLELLIIFFYFWYAAQFTYYWIKLGNRVDAYYAINFEKEAYANQNNLNYLKTRKFWSFLKY